MTIALVLRPLPEPRPCRSPKVSQQASPNREVAPAETPSRKLGEWELSLNAIQKANSREFAENGSFVRGSVGLTPAKSCCDYPGKYCPASSVDWVGTAAAPTPWDGLDFEMTKRFLFQYSYESDGQTFEARAVGDLDCDGETLEYVLRGRVANGNPSYELTKPTRSD